MAQETISGQVELEATPADDDLFVMVDVSDTTESANGSTKKVTFGNVLGAAYGVRPESFGGAPDGVTDSTTAIEDALDAVEAAGKGFVWLSPGVWVYNGTGLNPSVASFGIVGAGIDQTEVQLGATSRLVDTATALGRVLISGLTVRDGLGLFRSSITGNNISGHRIFRELNLVDYTACAIEVASQNSPFWVLQQVTFNGADNLETIGFAHGGKANGSSLRDCDFRRNRVHLKLVEPQDVKVLGASAFYRSDTDRTNGPVVDIWVVPGSADNVGGDGFLVDGVKFGSENLVAGDYNVLYADEDTGTTVGDTFPDLSTASTGYVVGHRFTGNKRRGSGAGMEGPFVYSMTPVVLGLDVSRNTFVGELPTYLLELDAGVNTSLIEERSRADRNIYPTSDTPAPVCNVPGVFLDDTAQTFQVLGPQPPLSDTNYGTVGHGTTNFLASVRQSSTAQNDEIVFRLPELRAGTWDLMFLHTRGGNRPIYTLAHSIDGSTWTDIGTVDGYNASTLATATELAGVTIPAGTKFLRVKDTDKNASSSSYVGTWSAVLGSRL